MSKQSTKMSIGKGAAIIAIASVVSKILGVLRDRIIAGEFGASFELDAYFTAFRIPDFIFNLLVLGALSSAFIPVFSSYLAKKGKENAFAMANTILNITMVALITISVIIAIAMEPIVLLIVPSSTSGEQYRLIVELSRLMLLSPIFFGISNIFSGILNSFKQFVAYSIAPIMYNIGIIFGALVLAPQMGIYGLVLGVIIGSIGHMLIQLPSVVRLGFRYRPYMRLEEGVKKIGSLMVPRTIGLGMLQINLLVTTAIAIRLSEGSVTIFNFANNIQSVPVSVFGISLAVSSFPFMAEALSKNDKPKFLEHFNNAFIKILFVTTPIALLVWLLRENIVRILLGTGEFGWEATTLTSETLGYFAAGVVAGGIIPLLARAFYAAHNTVIPVTVSIISMVINIVLSIVLSQGMGVPGLGLAFSIASIVQAIMLLIILRIKLGEIAIKDLLLRVLKVAVSSIIMIVGAHFLLQYLKTITARTTFVDILLELATVSVFGIVVYGALIIAMKEEEAIKYIKKIQAIIVRPKS